MLKKQDVQMLINNGFDIEMMDEVAPQGGLKFKENKVVAGDGYYACLHIKGAPTRPGQFWLSQLVGNNYTITTMDISTADKDEVVKNYNRSMNELAEQMMTERRQVDRNNAADKRALYERLAREINQGSDIPKWLDIRIWVVGDTEEQLEKRVANIQKTLKGFDYDVVLDIGDQENEMRAVTYSATDQRKFLNTDRRIQVTSKVIGGGLPFDHQELLDPNGIPIGVTQTDGAFIYDPFRITETRQSFSTMILGKSGSGKSTLMKCIADGMYGRNCLIRGFEINRDWRNWIETVGGKILDLSGKDGMLNPLEPMVVMTDDDGKVLQLESYYQHRDTFFTLIRFLYPTIDEVYVRQFEAVLDRFYISKGLLPENYQSPENRPYISIIGRHPEEYPTIQEFYDYFKQEAIAIQQGTPTEQELNAVHGMLQTLENMAISNGSIFNGHTTLSNLAKEKVLFFDLQTINGFDRKVKACLIFQSIVMTWSHAIQNGLRMKKLLNEKKLTPSEITYFLFFLDECQNILKPEYEFAVEYINKFVREMRKFSAGVFFATQSPQEMLPESASDNYQAQMKAIFNICSVRMLLNMDYADAKLLKGTLGNALTNDDYERISQLTKGQIIVNLGGRSNYQVTNKPTPQQLEIFQGGL